MIIKKNMVKYREVVLIKNENFFPLFYGVK